MSTEGRTEAPVGSNWLRTHLTPVGVDGDVPLLAPPGCTVVAVGEATHGSREFFEVRTALLRRMVEDRGCRVVALEASAAATVDVDAALRRGAPDDALADAFEGLGFWTWHVREMRELLAWVRARNATADLHDQVRVVGIDPQLPGAALRRLRVTVDGPASAPLRASQVSVRARDGRLLGRTDALRALLDTVTGARDGTGQDTVDRDLALLETGLRYELDGPRSGVRGRDLMVVRDQAMADAVLAVAASGAPVLLLAHNGHIAVHGPDAPVATLGTHLRAALGDRYYALAQLFGSGEYLAKSTLLTRVQRSPRTWSTRLDDGPSLVERVFDAAGERFVVDLAGTSDDPDAAWLDEDRLHRALGAVVTPVLHRVSALEVNLRSAYDGVVYHRRVSPSTWIPRRRDPAECSRLPPAAGSAR
ncbi:erythromycin esterase family protein [Cellulomonas timonensis]|uniref:erythromycin esterase family protein n=1 Tax=Cellulomonas timonensis TaxID=1689271 RepID=UPI00083667EF|nr:erythromycin esterase family protein [Cellulomonas timonensis]